MRVLHLGKFYPPHAGGVERHLADLAAAQIASGLDVATLVHAPPGDRQGYVRADDHGVPVHAVPCWGQAVFVPISPSWPLRFRRLLREFRPDLLHIHVPNPSAFWLLASWEARRIPWVVHWHADIPDDSRQWGLRLGYPIYRRFEHALNRRAQRIVATSSTYLDSSRALAPLRERCRTIPLGMPEAGLCGTAPLWPGEGLRLLAVGRLSYYKGFEVLLDALAQTSDIGLLLVGEGEQRDRLEARIAELDLTARVRLAGHLSDAELEAAYRACDVFCLPSVDRAEAFGLVLLEAMRAGKPVLASDIPGSGVGTVVVAEETGLKVPPRDAAALARALRRFARDVDLRQRLGAAGRTRWEHEYRIDAITQRWTALYRELLDASRAGSATPGSAGQSASADD